MVRADFENFFWSGWNSFIRGRRGRRLTTFCAGNRLAALGMMSIEKGASQNDEGDSGAFCWGTDS